MSLARLVLKKNEEKRIKGGHLWIFSNEVDTQKSPLKSFQTGQQVLIESASGQKLGTGYINPQTLLCARIVSRDPKLQLDRSLLVHKLNIAQSLRERCFDKPFYRLCYGESDGLPGLIVDRYNEHLVVQITTAGMEQHKEAIVDALCKVVKPTSILLRNDSSARKQEGLDSYVEQAFGETPEQIVIEENQTQFAIHPHSGQKTGWFYDHRISRKQIAQYAKGKKVLDVFSYIGAFGLQMATAGAEEVWCLDASSKALDELQYNAELNGVADRLTTVEGDAFTALAALKEQGERFDVIVVDPPAFIKKKKDHKAGLQGYRKINELAMRLLSKDGILLSASCSMHLKAEELQDILRTSSRHLDKQLQIIEQNHQGPDHPIHPAIPETRYIKGFISRVLSAS
ncbi:class I SAM-dependent rRNA methyltransferase [Pleionea sp. CnH1-48]|uniref:class I SAM-dependent rRNA methyltransferase n=1 Tax=Pleionea sp. CnH1-48 TaxID=2954494 RepID=UPI0020974330|nr:class I SAM-dependent rRNA methyltransferase [Pleionea sp. CnH1-48]MCO7225165.1 class I SAM-dependent rRNA methyltransferase [Pleionea sp. CnH1-48]